MNNLSRDDLESLSKGELLTLVDRGILRVMNTSPFSVSHKMNKQDLPEYKKHVHLRGQEIGINEASRKYDVHQPTITRWVKRGLIKRLGTGPNRMVLIDEADIAYCAEIYKNRPGQGRWLFKKDGTPYYPD